MSVTINGTNGIKFNDATVQSTKAVSLTDTTSNTGGNLSASRAAGVTYTNTLGRPMVLSLSAVNNNGTWPVFINGIQVASINGYGTTSGGSFIIPTNATYRIDNIPTTISWFEY